MMHCRCEVLHAQWAILLDDEFIEAYKHGIVIKCCDRIMRQFYPRILAYTANYPEKYVFVSPTFHMSCSNQNRVLLASIHDKGYCPCPQCLIPHLCFHNLGMVQDMKQRKTLAHFDDENRRCEVGIAWEIIYKKNYAINSPAVEAILKEQSLVPTLVGGTVYVCNYKRLIFACRMPFRKGLRLSVSIYLSCFLLISCMNSN